MGSASAGTVRRGERVFGTVRSASGRRRSPGGHRAGHRRRARAGMLGAIPRVDRVLYCVGSTAGRAGMRTSTSRVETSSIGFRARVAGRLRGSRASMASRGRLGRRRLAHGTGHRVGEGLPGSRAALAAWPGGARRRRRSSGSRACTGRTGDPPGEAPGRGEPSRAIRRFLNLVHIDDAVAGRRRGPGGGKPRPALPGQRRSPRGTPRVLLARRPPARRAAAAVRRPRRGHEEPRVTRQTGESRTAGCTKSWV